MALGAITQVSFRPVEIMAYTTSDSLLIDMFEVQIQKIHFRRTFKMAGQTRRRLTGLSTVPKLALQVHPDRPAVKKVTQEQAFMAITAVKGVICRLNTMINRL